jgi:magnesium transporter
LICAIYGMNFDTMPRLHWTFGYPLALGLMLLVALSGNLGLGEHR